MCVVLRDYGDNRARNRRLGPGGGTRRLHQISHRLWDGRGRNRIDGRSKGLAFARRGATVPARKVQLQTTIVLRLLWLRKQFEKSKL